MGLDAGLAGEGLVFFAAVFTGALLLAAARMAAGLAAALAAGFFAARAGLDFFEALLTTSIPNAMPT
jgi:hypothetical protein